MLTLHRIVRFKSVLFKFKTYTHTHHINRYIAFENPVFLSIDCRMNNNNNDPQAISMENPLIDQEKTENKHITFHF